MGFGIHPYFSTNLTGKADASKALISAPANKYWELDDVLVPTGIKKDVIGTLDLRTGQPFGKLKLDHVFTDVIIENGVSSLYYRKSGHRTWYDYGVRFCF